MFKILKTPGPGTYAPVDGINTEGTYAKSGHMRTRTPNIRKNTAEKGTKYDRIPVADIHKPGPGWYDHQQVSMSMTVFKRALPLTRSRQTSGFGSESRKVFNSKSCKYSHGIKIVVCFKSA